MRIGSPSRTVRGATPVSIGGAFSGSTVKSIEISLVRWPSLASTLTSRYTPASSYVGSHCSVRPVLSKTAPGGSRSIISAMVSPSGSVASIGSVKGWPSYRVYCVCRPISVGARLPPATSMAKAWVAAAPRASYARSTALACAGVPACGAHDTRPVAASTVMPSGPDSSR